MADLDHWQVLEWLARCDELKMDLSCAHETVNFFYCNTQQDAFSLADDLNASGHRIIERAGFREFESGDLWIVKSEVTLVLTPQSLEGLIDTCESAARKVDAEYDGWEVDAR